MITFKILHEDKKARTGILKTEHGEVETPNFVSVGTQATVKAISPKDLKEIGAQIILSNTYHLMLRPGADLIEKMGGLHKFMGWDGPMMTDSGGFQVFSLGVGLASGESKVFRDSLIDFNPSQRTKLAQINEEGVHFQSHLDGTKYFLSPETSIKIQHQLGVDLIVAFDDHESVTQTHAQTLESVELTERWGKRSLDALKKLKSKQLMYGVVHGGLHEDLRIKSAKFTDKYFDAISIGGIYGERKDLCQVIEWVTNVISRDKIRHLLGIGEVIDIFNGVERGMDMFDCVSPTRRARNGSLYVSPQSKRYPSQEVYKTNNFALNLKQAKFIADKGPIDPTCNCYTCQNFSISYLRHLYAANEILYHNLASYHNVHFIVNLMRKIRESIKNNQFEKLKEEWL